MTLTTMAAYLTLMRIVITQMRATRGKRQLLVAMPIKSTTAMYMATVLARHMGKAIITARKMAAQTAITNNHGLAA